MYCFRCRLSTGFEGNLKTSLGKVGVCIKVILIELVLVSKAADSFLKTTCNLLRELA